MKKKRIKKVELVEKEENERDYLEVQFKSSESGIKKQVFENPEKFLEECDCCGKPKFHHELDKADTPAKQTEKNKSELTGKVLSRF